jgi:hypothetical protein
MYYTTIIETAFLGIIELSDGARIGKPTKPDQLPSRLSSPQTRHYDLLRRYIRVPVECPQISLIQVTTMAPLKTLTRRQLNLAVFTVDCLLGRFK